MMLSAGNAWMDTKQIVGIFDLDITSRSYITREFLKTADRSGRVVNAAEDIPKSFTVTVCNNNNGAESKVVLSQYSSSVLRNRAERSAFR